MKFLERWGLTIGFPHCAAGKDTTPLHLLHPKCDAVDLRARRHLDDVLLRLPQLLRRQWRLILSDDDNAVAALPVHDGQDPDADADQGADGAGTLFSAVVRL